MEEGLQGARSHGGGVDVCPWFLQAAVSQNSRGRLYRHRLVNSAPHEVQPRALSLCVCWGGKRQGSWWLHGHACCSGPRFTHLQKGLPLVPPSNWAWLSRAPAVPGDLGRKVRPISEVGELFLHLALHMS